MSSGASRSRSRNARKGCRLGAVEPDALRLQVFQVSGAHLTEVRAEPLQRISDVKRALAAAAEAPARYLRLLCGARELQNERTVKEECLESGSQLSLVRCAPESGSLLAVPEDDPLLVPFLINSGVDPNETDDLGWTALHWASHRGHVAAGEALLARREFEAVNQQDMGKMTALHFFAQHGHAVLCEALAQRPDFLALNARSANGNTALHWAARSGHPTACEALLGLKGFNAVNDQNMHGWTALHYAAAVGLTKVCELLLDHPNFTAVGELTNNGETALHWAALNGRLEVCKLLFGKVDASLHDVEGMTALDGAKMLGHEAVCALLAGA